MNTNEVVDLMEKMDRLIEITLSILSIKKLQGELFIGKVDEVVRPLKTAVSPILLDQLVEETLPLALPVGDFVEGPMLRTLASNLEHTRATCYGWGPWGGEFTREVQELIEQFGLNENKLEKFLDDTDLYNNWEDLRNDLVLQPSREVARALLQASHELKATIIFFHEVVSESALLFLQLEFLLRFFRELQNECSDDLIECIGDVAKKALGAASCSKEDRLIWHFWIFRKVLWDSSTRSTETKKDSIDEMARKFFYGKEGFRLVLLETLGKLHAFTGEIEIICKKFGREDLLMRNASFIFSYIAVRDGISGFPLRTEIKRRRMVLLRNKDRNKTKENGSLKEGN